MNAHSNGVNGVNGASVYERPTTPHLEETKERKFLFTSKEPIARVGFPTKKLEFMIYAEDMTQAIERFKQQPNLFVLADFTISDISDDPESPVVFIDNRPSGHTHSK